MQERLKELPKKFLEYWNKWTSKQKTIIISAVSAVIIMVAILVVVLGRTSYVELDTFEDTKTASNIISLLRENEIDAKLASDNLTVMVDEEKQMDAMMAVSVSDLVESGFDWQDMLDTSLTTTNGERLTRNHLRLENDLETMLINYTPGVKDVTISYIPRDTSNTILTSSKSIPVSVMLVTDSRFDEDSALGIANWVAYAVGNETLDTIRIIDQNGNLLFNGPEEEKEDEIDVTDKMSIQMHLQETYIDTVTGAILMNNFTEVNVAPYLAINFDKVTELFTEYLPIEGEIHGVLTEYHETSSEGSNGSGDIPGTDSNDEVDYYLQDGTSGTYETYTEDDYYEPSVRVTNKVYDNGSIDAANSSIAVTATRVLQRTEEELEILGLLDDMSFEEYVLRNSDPIRTETDAELVSVIAMSTGIPEDNITLITYDIYQYTPKEEVARDWTFYLQILLAVILVAFLLFVVFRGMAPVEVTELEPELSVEQLLATTKENQSLEDVEFSEQSETRKMIEKFFDENPEAVAQLLRNWLNEDWD
ncbi:MAG: hypothetical protein J6J42_13790 [Lachnospiraceae bacterium]|nr:hypothetical protein [Lachnospiraceae bacterium]MBP3611395.1 hypothetical protein [Lachnospiraceae bacterium]